MICDMEWLIEMAKITPAPSYDELPHNYNKINYVHA